MSASLDIAHVRMIIEDEETRLTRMKRAGVSNERQASLVHEIDAWKRRLHALGAAPR